VYHKIIYMSIMCVRMNIVSVLLRVRLLVCIIIKYICPSMMSIRSMNIVVSVCAEHIVMKRVG